MTGREQPIEDRVGDGRIPDPCVPMLDRQRARDDRRARAGTIVDDLHQVRARESVERNHPPVVQDKDVGARHRRQPTSEASVAVQDAQFLGQARRAQIQRRAPAPARVLRQGATQQTWT